MQDRKRGKEKDDSPQPQIQLWYLFVHACDHKLSTMPKPRSSGSSSGDPPKTKKRKLDKKKQRNNKKKKPSRQEELSNVCNITGISGSDDQGFGDVRDDFGYGGLGNELDCLNELATAQIGDTSPAAAASGNIDGETAEESRSQHHPQTQPPTLHEIPNLRVELARHLQVETLSIFLLQSCPGLRMPTFERWLLDSKLEESDRMQSIAEDWVANPSSKLHFKNQKKKYGRAALHSEENATQGREDARRMKESRLLLEAEKSTHHEGKNMLDKIGRLVMNTRALIDPILPGNPLETDLSSTRLVDEIIATNLKMNDKSDETMITKQKAEEIVSELLSRCSDSVKEIQQLKNRFGMYQQFGFGKKKNKSSGSSSSGLVRVEWPSGDSTTTTKKSSPDDSVCSLSYITTKKKSSTSVTSDNKDEAQKKSKPFIVKVNGQHYHKLRRLFDETYLCTDSSVTKEQMTHAFHAALFAIVIRYSTLAGGQQLNVLRGGGMQGAIHDTVFECFEKWFGTPSSSHGSGTECFASPFNANMTQYYSAFPSPDIDGFFGSQGDFFRLDAKSLRPGWYEANPPFSPGIMKKMATRIMDLLNVARERDIDVTFIVVIPSCHSDNDDKKDGQDASDGKKSKKKKKKHKHDGMEDEQSNTSALTHAIHHGALSSFNMLVKNCSNHIVLSKRDHGYVEGSQHLRPTQFKESQYDSSVIVLRSKSCADIDTKAFEANVREAFKSRHLVELQQRRDCN
jgi:phosphorylated CTD-interacting factor 1